MSNLPTNYVDDVLNADVNTRRKYQMIQNGDGTVSLVDVTDYDTVGSSIGAAQINAQNTQINQNTEDISSLNQHLTELIEGGVKMKALDYSNGTRIPMNGTAFVPSVDGVLLGGFGHTSAVQLQVNGKPVAKAANGEPCLYVMAPVSAGQSVSYTASLSDYDATVYFYPYLAQ